MQTEDVKTETVDEIEIALRFKIGDVVQLLGAYGPLLSVAGYVGEMDDNGGGVVDVDFAGEGHAQPFIVQCDYYNAMSGSFEHYDFYEDQLVLRADGDKRT